MRLYTTSGATQIDDPEHGTFVAGPNGVFDGLPDAMYAKLHGRPGWENEPEREARVTREEMDRFRDPAELLKAVKELGANQGLLTAAIAHALGLATAPAPTDTPVPVDATPPAPTSASDTPPDGDATQQQEQQEPENAAKSGTTTARRGKKAAAAD